MINSKNRYPWIFIYIRLYEPFLDYSKRTLNERKKDGRTDDERTDGRRT